MSSAGGGDMNNGGGPPHASIKRGDKEVAVSESEWQKLLEWLQENHPHIYTLLTN